jgi:hypothetical protein
MPFDKKTLIELRDNLNDVINILIKSFLINIRSNE